MSVATIQASRRAALRTARPSTAPVKVLWVLLAMAMVRGLLYAVLNPPFASPDEGAHFQYVAYLATNGAFGPIGDEGHQPVLYYALMVPAYWLTSGQSQDVQLLAIRIASIPFLLGTVVFTWLAARQMAPNKPFVPVVAAAFVALQPELAYFSASANNDNAANFMAAVLVYFMASLLGGKTHRWTVPATAAAIGVSLVTKGQILPVSALSAVVLIGYVLTLKRVAELGRLLLYAAVPMLLAAALLAGRAGERMLETAATSGSMVGDWPKAWDLAQQASLQPFLYMFTSFWAAFVGESLHPADVWYLGPSAIMLLAVIGYLLGIASSGRESSPSGSAALLRLSLLFIVISVWLVAYLRFLYNFQDDTYTWRLQVLQGRYLHVALVPLALLVAEGWSLLTQGRFRTLSSGAILGLLAVLDISSVALLANYYRWPAS